MEVLIGKSLVIINIIIIIIIISADCLVLMLLLLLLSANRRFRQLSSFQFLTVVDVDVVYLI